MQRLGDGAFKDSGIGVWSYVGGIGVKASS